MSEYKCMASQDGVCRNMYAFGIKCNGYSKECKLRPAYNSVQNACIGYIESIRKSFGIIGDEGEAMEDKYWTSDDITFCMSKCNRKTCFRHRSHIHHHDILHSFAYLEGTKYCEKYYDEKERKKK